MTKRISQKRAPKKEGFFKRVLLVYKKEYVKRERGRKKKKLKYF